MAFTPTEEAQLRAVITAFERGKTISEIDASTEVFTTDALEIIQEAVSKKATVAQIVTLVNSELGISSISSKLSGIEDGAQVNIIESVKVNSTLLPIDSKSVDITVPTQPSDIGAEPLLPSTPSNPESRFLNGNKQWAEIVLGSGGYASNVYFTNLTSTIVGSYKQTSGTHELTETIASGTCNNNEVLIHTYLFEQPVGITTVDAGVWRVTLNSIIDAAAGDSKFKFVQFKRSAAGVETDMFTVYSNTIENRVGYEGYLNNIFETVQPSFSVDATDRLGCRIYATTTAAGSRTLSYKVGDGFASYLNTPLALRHSQLRDPNGNPNVQHLTAAQVTKVDATSGVNTGDETTATIKSKLGFASSASSGYLKNTDWVTFNDKQPAGNYSADIHSNITALNSVSGTNTGDETLTSIKTKLGAADAFNDGYLKYQDWSRFNSKEPAITKNSGFNLPLGNTPGTVLEGRTFGTAANSAVGDFIQNQNSSPQSANMWINGEVKAYSLNTSVPGLGADNFINFINDSQLCRLGIRNPYGSFGLTFVDPSNNYYKIYHEGNLTSSLSTNYLPKWNGSSLVNAIAGTDYQLPITLTTNGTSGAATFSGNVLNVPNYGGGATSGQYTPTLTNAVNISSSSITSSIYTHIGNVYTLAIRGEITPAASGSCALRISIPAGMSSATGSFVSSAVSSTGSISHASWVSVGGLGTTYLTLIIEAPSTSPIAFSITGSYLHQ